MKLGALVCKSECSKVRHQSPRLAFSRQAIGESSNGLSVVDPAFAGSEVTTKLLNFSDKSGKNVEATSGRRTVEQNRTVGGASRSQHLQDNAADARINGSTAKRTADAAHGSGEFNRVNQYTDGRGVHVDLKQDGTQGPFTDWKPKK
jgi:hypothetical protein